MTELKSRKPLSSENHITQSQHLRYKVHMESSLLGQITSQYPMSGFTTSTGYNQLVLDPVLIASMIHPQTQEQELSNSVACISTSLSKRESSTNIHIMPFTLTKMELLQEKEPIVGLLHTKNTTSYLSVRLILTFLVELYVTQPSKSEECRSITISPQICYMLWICSYYDMMMPLLPNNQI